MRLHAFLSTTALALAFTQTALAQGNPPTSAPTKTADYVEQSLAGDQVVTFTGDELAAGNASPNGSIMIRVKGAARTPLIRPRLNFVSELLKTVENL